MHFVKEAHVKRFGARTFDTRRNPAELMSDVNFSTLLKRLATSAILSSPLECSGQKSQTAIAGRKRQRTRTSKPSGLRVYN